MKHSKIHLVYTGFVAITTQHGTRHIGALVIIALLAALFSVPLTPAVAEDQDAADKSLHETQAMFRAYLPVIARADEIQPPLDELQEIIERIAREVAVDPPSTGAGFRLEEARDPNAPATMLGAAIAAFDNLNFSFDGQGLRQHLSGHHVEDARLHVEQAWDELVRQIAPDLDHVLALIGHALEELSQSDELYDQPYGDNQKEISSQLAQVAHIIAARVVEAAARADPDTLLQAQIALAQGDEHQRADEFVLAVEFYRVAVLVAIGGIGFDSDLFELNIREALAGQTIGYSYFISTPGEPFRPGRHGNARTEANALAILQSWNKPMYNASMSKTISAMALLKLLQDRGISVETPIATYLPADWSQGPNVQNITFKRLLTHRSGLDVNQVTASGAENQSYEVLRQLVGQGSAGSSDNQASNYTNVNYSLLRILIPNIYFGRGWIASTYTAYFDQGMGDVIYGGLYTWFVREYVLKWTGFGPNEGCDPRELPDTRTYYYTFTLPASPGTEFGNWCQAIGATGWYLTTAELYSLVAIQSVTSAELFNTETRILMDEMYLGWLDPVQFGHMVDGAFGIYRGHGGDIWDGNGRGMTGCMMKFPNGGRVSLQVNSRGGDIGGHPCTVLRDAYDNAFVAWGIFASG